MRLVFARAARQDLLDIVDYIAADNATAAAGVYRKIMATSQRLVDFPGLGRVGQLADTRELAVAGLPYLMVYEVRDDAVTILAVLHMARNVPRLLHERNTKSRGSS